MISNFKKEKKIHPEEKNKLKKDKSVDMCNVLYIF